MPQLELSKTYPHFSKLIWQVPSIGTAIAAGTIVAANQVGKDRQGCWALPISVVQAFILLLGFILLIALCVALYRFRVYHRAAAPKPLPCPPFKTGPSANRYLQGSLSLTAGVLGGLALSQALGSVWAAWCMAGGVIAGFIGWIFAERGFARVAAALETPATPPPHQNEMDAFP